MHALRAQRWAVRWEGRLVAAPRAVISAKLSRRHSSSSSGSGTAAVSMLMPISQVPQRERRVMLKDDPMAGPNAKKPVTLGGRGTQGATGNSVRNPSRRTWMVLRQSLSAGRRRGSLPVLTTCLFRIGPSGC